MKSKKLEKFIQEYLNGSLSDEEFKNLIRDFSNEDIKQHIKESIEIDYLVSLKYNDIDSNAAFINFLSRIKIEQTNSSKVVHFNRRSILKYAAIFLGIIGLAYFAVEKTISDKEMPSLKIDDKVITLQFKNNNSKTITSGDESKIMDEEGNIIATQEGDRIKYSPQKPSKELVYNKLNIPYGKTFKVELSDGTVVHLNSGSTLRYPINFIDGRNREVFIDGEAYFHVAKDTAHPFIVNASQLNIRVLGTQFNVSSYKEDDNINTVLVSGSVQLFQGEASSANTVKLSPGKIAKYNKSIGSYQVEQVDTQVYTAWIQGKLIFKNATFKNIREKLERHYNVVIINNNKLLEYNTFNARFDTESIEEVMEVFDRSFGIKYKIVNNEIIIY